MSECIYHFWCQIQGKGISGRDGQGQWFVMYLNKKREKSSDDVFWFCYILTQLMLVNTRLFVCPVQEGRGNFKSQNNKSFVPLKFL